jgi:hypothetical protein
MNRRQQPRAPDDTPVGREQKHHRVLLHALHTAHPVAYQGKHCFIHTITFQQEGGNITATVYLAGDPKPVKPADLTLWEAPE